MATVEKICQLYERQNPFNFPVMDILKCNTYRKTSSISRTKSQNLNACNLA